MSSYSECEKLSKVSKESQKIGEFLEWLKCKYTLCVWVDGHREPITDADDEVVDYTYFPEGYYPARPQIQDILAEYFGIDMKKVDQERGEILKKLREQN